MNGRPHSTTNASPAKRARGRVLPSLLLLSQVAEQVADIARVPAQEHEPFCDSVCDSVQTIWKRDRRTELSRPGEALKKAAYAARTLDQAFGSLNKADRGWVGKLLNQEPAWSQERLIGRAPQYEPLRELSLTVWLLAGLFSAATGEVSSPLAGVARLPLNPGKKRGTVNDTAFHDFVHTLLVYATEAGGRLTVDKNKSYKEGTLVEGLHILRPYLPRGVIPKDLTSRLSTLQRIKTKHSKARSFNYP